MTIQTINVGGAANDGSGDTLRAAMQKVNANFASGATTTEPGMMAAADKSKLNGIAAGATATAMATAAPSALGTAAVGTSAKAAREDHVHAAADLAGASTTGTLPASKGGTGASTAAAARTNLGVPYSEEGTYTPTVYVSSTTTSTFAYTTQEGFYSRIGNLVFVYFRMVFVPTITSGEDNIFGVALPFSVNATYYGGGIATYLSGTFTWVSGGDVIIRPQRGTSYARMTENIPGGNPNTFSLTKLTSGSSHEWWGHVWYRLA